MHMSVIGCGYLGAANAVCMAKPVFEVIGVEIGGAHMYNPADEETASGFRSMGRR